MFENHVMQMFDTRELEMRARLSERRVGLVAPFGGGGNGVLARLAAALRHAVRPPRTTANRSTAPSAQCL